MNILDSSPMDRLFPVLFLLLGFCSFTESTLCDYVLIQEQKTWDEAQAYCRRTHIDLATVQSTEDLASLQEAVYKMAEMTWIGLYNDINSWRWSYQDEKITFQNWYIGEPNNFDGHEECAVMQENGTWNDCGCTQLFPFFCYREDGTNRFVFISDTKTWKDAQSYCRQDYTDLVIIQNQTDNNQLTVMMKPYTNAWIGLFRDVWKWSLSPLPSLPVSTSFVTWMTGKPNMNGLQRPCGVSDSSGLISDQLCSNVLPFLCMECRFVCHSGTNTLCGQGYSGNFSSGFLTWKCCICKCELRKQQIVRLKVKSSQNLNDPAVMETVLQWIKQNLKERGIEKDTKVAWNIQPDGNCFHMIKNKP